MKKIIGIIITITVIIILAGCSSTKKGVDNMGKPSENASFSSNQQSQSQSEDTSPKIKDTNSNTNSNLLESIDTTKSQFEKGYSQVVDNKSDQDVENFVSKIQSYIANDNKAQLAEEIKYPINVKTNGKAIKIQNKDDLIKNYDKIFTVDYKQKISKASNKYLFANYQEIMVGDLGQIWINDVISAGDNSSKLMIIAINN